MAHYTTKGSVRGCCGHRHRTVETAARCLDRDILDCRRAGGYSDRNVVGVGVEMTAADEDRVIVVLNKRCA